MIVTPYNLLSKMCKKYPYLFLTCIILGLDNLKAKNNAYLLPLTNELNKLWCMVF